MGRKRVEMEDEKQKEHNEWCEMCGERKSDVTLRRDPFLWEVYDEEVLKYLCDDCWQTRKDDV
jgi:hypothetical protein